MGYTETRGKYRVGVCMGWAGVFFPSIYIVPVKKIYIENKKIYFRKKLSWVSDRRKIGLVFYFFYLFTWEYFHKRSNIHFWRGRRWGESVERDGERERKRELIGNKNA